jgi:protease IV
MQLNRIIALLLVVICFVAAAVGIQRQQTEQAFNFNSTPKTDRLELVRVEGAITGSGSSLTGAMASRDRLIEITKEDSVKGVLLLINSPGGTVGASKELYEAVKLVNSTKPVVVSMLDQATSGGYYAASAASKIYANPGTLTGSIGVILSGLNFKALLDRVGVEPQTIKTGAFKDIFSPYRQISEPEKQFLQELLQDTYKGFLADVSAGRKMDIEKLRKLADGRIYTGTQAQANGLVDVVGTYTDALNDLRLLARKKFNLPETKDLPIESNERSLKFFLDQIFGQSSLKSPVNKLFTNLAQKFMGTQTTVSNYEPPILLMPSWFSSL